MGLGSKFASVMGALVGISEYAGSVPALGPALSSPQVEAVRRAFGGQLQPLTSTETRWNIGDLELAQHAADMGDLTIVGQLSRAMKRDGVIGGLCKTRTAGLIALPKRWRGFSKAVAALQATNGTRPLLDELAPPQELALLAEDAIKCGVAIGENVPVKGRKHPKFVRLDPQFLRWRQNESRWYYSSVAGALPVTPGDGRWVMHFEGGVQNPWQSGSWHALGRAFITKEHAMYARKNFAGKLANPARYAKAVTGATETERTGFIEGLIRWGINTVFELPPGWEVGILETNGRGWEVFGTEIETANFEAMIELAGQIVTTTGGSGFANADIHRTIRADLIKTTADALALTVNTQIIAPWAWGEYGEAIIEELPRLEWDVQPPEDRKVAAEALKAAADASEALVRVFEAKGLEVDAAELAARFGVPLTGKKVTPPKPEASSDPGADDNDAKRSGGASAAPN